MAVFQPPPTWASPVIVDEVSKKATFNPVWLKWFVDLVGILNASGGGGGAIQHNSLNGLQGGQANQLYHNTLAENTKVVAWTGNSSANLLLPAGTTGIASLRIPHGSAPTTPVNGDMWTTTAGLFIRINGATVGPLS